jgi:hypothetical protein
MFSLLQRFESFFTTGPTVWRYLGGAIFTGVLVGLYLLLS